MKQVKGYIERKSMLYKTGVEYGDFTMNHVMGCAHGCGYPCYAFLMARRFGKVKNLTEWLEPYLVVNTLEILDREIPRLKHRIESVQLCFTTDPFMYEYDEIASMSLAAIKMLNSYGIKCTVLTKGLLPIELAKCSSENEYGITIISLDESYRIRVEPGAANYENRISALKKLSDLGRRTWASIEPYPTPNLINQDLSKLLDEIGFVDKIVFGRTNYNKQVSAFPGYKEYYNEQAHRVIDFCNQKQIQVHIKTGTLTE